MLAAHPEKYLDQTPAIIPVQGEHPHGIFHGMHAGWRLYWPFLCRIAEPDVLDIRSIKQDPNVSDFSFHRFFLFTVVRACSEFITDLGEDDAAATAFDCVSEYMAKSESNIDFAWVVHFLYDYGFWVLDFLQSVRSNQSERLDVLWREFFVSRTLRRQTRHNMSQWRSCEYFGDAAY